MESETSDRKPGLTSISDSAVAAGKRCDLRLCLSTLVCSIARRFSLDFVLCIHPCSKCYLLNCSFVERRSFFRNQITMVSSVSAHPFFLVILLLFQVFPSIQQQDTSSSGNIPSDTNSLTGTTTGSTDSLSTSTTGSGVLTTTNTESPTVTLSPSTTFDTVASSTLPALSTPKPSSKGSNAGAIAGGVVGGLACLGVVVALILFFRRRGFSASRGHSWASERSHPPSPKLKNPWLSGVGGGTSNRPQRLHSVGGESVRSPPHSNQGHGPAYSDDAHELGTAGYSYHNASASTAGGGPEIIPSSGTGQHRTSTSRTSVPGSRANSRPSYDLNVFSANTSTTPREGSREGDPFGSETSITSPTTPVPPSDLTRAPSASRVARKPAPKYNDSEPSSPTTPRESKPPVSRPPRARTYSNSSSLRAAQGATGAAAAGSSSRSSLEAAHLAHRGSQSTLGGTFKFAGEKEGPVHFLIPDAPSPAMH